MLKEFKQFVPSSVCLQCDGCCRFKDADSRWRPYIGEIEKDGVKKIIGSTDGRITTVPCREGFLCCFLNSSDNTCGIYPARPFECQLYPFLLGKEGEKTVLYVHLNCPYVQEQWGTPKYKDYAQYLREFFTKKEVLEFLKQNPAIFTDYSAFRPELDYVCDIAWE